MNMNNKNEHEHEQLSSFQEIFSYFIKLVKKNYSENISTPKVGVLNVEFALKLRIYSLICFK